MGHRALVAYASGDGRYDLYYAHWGAADLSLAGRLGDPGADPVEPDPLAVTVSFGVVVREHVDPPIHEALYVVEAGTTRVYRALWLGPLGVNGGLLVAVDSDAPCDDARVRGWFSGARALATVCREHGECPPGMAATLLEARLRAWAGDREVLRCPGT